MPFCISINRRIQEFVSIQCFGSIKFIIKLTFACNTVLHLGCIILYYCSFLESQTPRLIQDLWMIEPLKTINLTGAATLTTLWQSRDWHSNTVLAWSQLAVVVMPVSEVVKESWFEVVKTLPQRSYNVGTSLDS